MPIRPLQFFAALGIAWPSAVAAGVVINEIHYDADPKTAAVEFVELHNTGDRTEHLGGWYFSNGIDFTFAANTALKPGGYLVVAENPAKLRAEFRTPKQLVLGPYIGRLSNGETLTLRNDPGESGMATRQATDSIISSMKPSGRTSRIAPRFPMPGQRGFP